MVQQKASQFTSSILAGLAITACPYFAQKLPSSAEPASVALKAMAQGPAADYIGAERCRSCHKPEFTEFQKTVHAKLTPPRATYITACVRLIGPGRGIRMVSNGKEECRVRRYGGI